MYNKRIDKVFFITRIYINGNKVIPKNLGLLKQVCLHATVNNLTINDIYIKGHSCWCKCTCTCGKEVDFKLTSVIRSRNKSCGCAVSPEAASERNKAFWKNHHEKLAVRAHCLPIIQ